MLLALLLALPVLLKRELRAQTAADASMLRLLAGAPASMLRVLAAAAMAALDASKLCLLFWPAAPWPSKLVRRCCGCGGRCDCCCCWLLHAQKLLLAANCCCCCCSELL
jgi:hypothetical protein